MVAVIFHYKFLSNVVVFRLLFIYFGVRLSMLCTKAKGGFFMNFDPCSAAKDCLRTYYLVLDDMKYALMRARPQSSISEALTTHLEPLHRAALSLSQGLLGYSSYKPVRDVAEYVCEDKMQSLKNMRNAKRGCSFIKSSHAELEEYMKRFNAISERLIEETYGAEMSERINCDYIRQMTPLLEGEIRIAENALGFYICQGLETLLRDVIESDKRILHSMHKLIRMLDHL